MALDEPGDQDVVEEVNGITFCMQKDLYERVGGVTVDLGYMGFAIMTEFPYSAPGQSGCSSCGGSCSI